MEEIELKVGEARAGDVGRGIARVESKVMEKLNLSSGDVIEILCLLYTSPSPRDRG